MARDFERNAANSARKDLRNLMDNVAGAPGIPQDDALFTVNLQNQANPEEVSLEASLAETPDLEDQLGH